MDEAALIEGLTAQGRSRKTIAVYLVAVRRAERGLGARGLTLEAVSGSQLAAWVDDELPASRSSRALTRSALAAYWTAVGRPDAPWRAVRVPRRPRMRCRALEDPQAARLAAVARSRALEGTRKGLAVLLGLYGGLRRSEIAEVRWDDLTGDGWLRVVGKGSERMIPLHPVLVEALAAARSAVPPPRRRPGRPEGRVFAGAGGGHLNPTTVWTWVRQLAAEAELPPLQTHVLRHTALATALDATRDLRAVQELAGHARPETTAGYTRVRADRLVGAVRAISYGEAR